ncbi:fimbrial protein [Pseudomonas sp. X10]
MKRILTLFTLGLCCSSAMAAETGTGIITFEGNVGTGGTCPINVVMPGGSSLPKVYLGDFNTKDFKQVGLKTPMQKFGLRVDTDVCTLPTDATATVKFTAGYGEAPSGLYKLQSGHGYSSGFAMAIYDKSDTQLKPGDESVVYEDIENTDMNFTAQLHTIEPAVTEGHISTSVNFLVAIP